MGRSSIEAVTDETLGEFAGFLKQHLDPARSVEDWTAGLRTGWCADRPNYGYVLRDAGRIVGGIGAIYATRLIRGRQERFCNITSWCVLDDYRQQSMRLAMSLIGQSGFHFTDFSPTRVVAASLLFLKFRPMDDRQIVMFNLPALSRGRVLSSPAAIRDVLAGQALQAYEDHAVFPWLEHVALGADGKWCHVIYKPMRFRRLKAARVLHVSDRAIFGTALRAFGSYLLWRGVATTHIDFRQAPGLSAPHAVRSGFVPKVYRSESLGEDDIDYLYSESMAFDLI